MDRPEQIVEIEEKVKQAEEHWYTEIGHNDARAWLRYLLNYIYKLEKELAGGD